MYFQLAGRILLIFLFIGFVFAGDWSFGRVVVILFGAVACVMVVVGFKAKMSAIVLVMILSVFNILVNNFWTVSVNRREHCRDVSANQSCSCILITHTRISPSMTSSKSCQSWVDFYCWSTWAPDSSVWTRRRRCTRFPSAAAQREDEHRKSKMTDSRSISWKTAVIICLCSSAN